MLFRSRKSTFRKNSGNNCKPPILPEDSRSQKTRRRGEKGGPHHLAARWAHGRVSRWCGGLGHPLATPSRLLNPLDLKRWGNNHISRNPYGTPPPSRTLFRGSETPFWHPAGMGIWRRSSPSSSPTLLHRRSMFPHP